jgi:hypothetical protein
MFTKCLPGLGDISEVEGGWLAKSYASGTKETFATEQEARDWLVMQHNKTFEHFADHVPQDIRQALKELAEHAAGELDGFNGAEGFGEAQVSKIWGKNPGGFIPFQDGGFEASLLIRFDIDESYHVSEGMTEEANRYDKMATENALTELGLPAETPWGDLTDEQRETVWEHVDAIFNVGALLRFECWQDRAGRVGFTSGGGSGQVFLRLSVNYSDGPYFRSKDDETLHELSLSPEVLLEAVKRWPDDWQARLWRQLTTKQEEKKA